MYSYMNANGASRPGSNPTTTVKQLFDLMADLSGLPAPRIKAPVPVVRVAAAVREFAAQLTGKRPMIDRSQVDKFAGKYGYFSSVKAQRELGSRSRKTARENYTRLFPASWKIRPCH